MKNVLEKRDNMKKQGFISSVINLDFKINKKGIIIEDFYGKVHKLIYFEENSERANYNKVHLLFLNL